MNPEVILISHPNVTWPGAVDLRTAADGWLLAITRNPVRDGASRLIDEGFGPSTTLVIRDANDARPEIRTTIKEAMKG
ncbi:hypothetical protein BF49_6878 [Bradyrhizobium sp.]|uniref:hypothetical protein n=1 Tax=Bradyrhizobium sp. TaxID=376 RepID=UPI0007C197CD|nr:hypothetical protein [Bradyrhizobium sp.]CUT15798.1 hypothetical protein BF49_6878 [Bradyrhizobium sp.]